MVEFWLVDVFAERPLSGNGLAVFVGCDELAGERMQLLTQEMRQFESVFLSGDGDSTVRIFTPEEELPFAGHPVLGAAAVCHLCRGTSDETMTSRLRLGSREVAVTTERLSQRSCRAVMDQGAASFGAVADASQTTALARAFGLERADLAALPAMTVSTGLPYLVLPLTPGSLERAQPRQDHGRLLDALAADFVYLLDVAAREGRTWDRAGQVEDVATGSAAGPVFAYVERHGLVATGEVMQLSQGRFVGRPSRIDAWRDGDAIRVAGEVHLVAAGRLLD